MGVTILQGSMDEAGRAIAGENGYSPRVVPQAVPIVPKKAETSLKEGLEIQGVTELIREIYGPPANGQRPIEWAFESLGGGEIQATLTVPQDGSTHEGPVSQGQQMAKRMAAKAAWEALKSLQDGEAEDGEVEAEAEDEDGEAEPM